MNRSHQPGSIHLDRAASTVAIVLFLGGWTVLSGLRGLVRRVAP